MKRPFHHVPKKGFKYVPKGEKAEGLAPGDFVLTHTDHWISKLIRFGQGIRYNGDKAKFAYWNHAAIITSPNGDIVEALGDGIKQTHIDKYSDRERVVVNIDAAEADRLQMMRFVSSCVGMEYGYATFLAIGVSLLTGLRFVLAFDSQYICSGLVARALERTDAIFSENTTKIMPASLAEMYDVEIPA